MVSDLTTVTNICRSGDLNWGKRLFIVFCCSWYTSRQAYNGNCKSIKLIYENKYNHSWYGNMINVLIEIVVNVVVYDTL